MFDLTDRVAVVTGGSRGIGRAAATALAEQGAHVVLGYVHGEEAAKAAAQDIASRGGKAEIAQFDVASDGDKAIPEIAKRLGRLDILVASAGISIDGLVLRYKAEDFDKQVAVNLWGAIKCARGALKPMMRAKYGRIIFLSSVVGEMGNAGQMAYSATKAGLLGVTKSLAREYASRGVTVNAVAPGYIQTDMTAALNDEQRAAMLGAVPLARAGTPQDVAAAITFLASREAGYITGETLRVNGGMYM